MKPPAKTSATTPTTIEQIPTVPLDELTQVSGGEGEGAMGGAEGGGEFGMAWGGGGAGAMLQSGHSVMT